MPVAEIHVPGCIPRAKRLVLCNKPKTRNSSRFSRVVEPPPYLSPCMEPGLVFEVSGPGHIGVHLRLLAVGPGASQSREARSQPGH